MNNGSKIASFMLGLWDIKQLQNFLKPNVELYVFCNWEYKLRRRGVESVTNLLEGCRKNLPVGTISVTFNKHGNLKGLDISL